MINVYDWSYEIEQNLVRIEFYGRIKTRLKSAVEKFNGQPMPVKTQPNELIVRFKNTKVVNDFIAYTLEQYPNCFRLNNNWDITKVSTNVISFTAMEESQNTLSSLSKILNSFIVDCNTISNLTKNELVNIQINVDATICYITFNISFVTDKESEDFFKDFIRFKA